MIKTYRIIYDSLKTFFIVNHEFFPLFNFMQINGATDEMFYQIIWPYIVQNQNLIEAHVKLIEITSLAEILIDYLCKKIVCDFIETETNGEPINSEKLIIMETHDWSKRI